MKSRNAGQLPLIIIGDAADCDKFTKAAVKVADLILQRPLTAAVIEQRINVFFKNSKKQMHEPIAEELKKSRPLPFNENISAKKQNVPDVTDMPDIRDIAKYTRNDFRQEAYSVIDDDAVC